LIFTAVNNIVRMKKIPLLIVFFFTLLFAKAQQIGMYSHYFFKPMVYNPAFTGFDGDVNAMIVNRSQWTDFKGAPQLNLATLDGNVSGNKVGLGLSFISDRKGITNRIGAYLNYSYRLNINDNTHVRFGIAAGVVDQSIDYSKAIVENANDPFLFSDVQRKTALDANAGLAFIWKDLEFGVAVPQLAGNKINYVDNMNVRSYYTQARHYMGTLKYKIFVSKEKGISVAPQALVRFLPGAPLQYDGTIIFDWREKFWIGGTYKSGYAVAANAGVCLHKQLYVGYSYDIIIGNIGKYSGMSHEIMVSFKFGKNKKNDNDEALSKIAAKNDANEKRLDSLQNELSISQDKLREDQRKISENQNKINELNNKLDQQSKAIQQIGSSPQNTSEQKNPVEQNNPVATEQNNKETQNQVSENKSTPVNQNNKQTPVTENQNNKQTPVKNNENQNSAAVASNTDKIMDGGVWIVSNKTKDFKDESNRSPQKGYYVIAGTFFYKDFAQNEVKRLKNSGYKSVNYFYFEPKQFNYVFIAKESTREAAIKKANEAKAAGIKDAWIQMLVE
jgi:type IX secretion system PorP/SprF family membrane protein